MNWRYLRKVPWIDTRARFVSSIRARGSLLDIGSSDGETLNHFAELRPDLELHATDIAGSPESYPYRCEFHRCDIQHDMLPWATDSMDGITCMHLVEHLDNRENLMAEARRLLKPDGCAYFETPHPRTVTYSSPTGPAAGTFTLNFYDDTTHTCPVPVGALAKLARKAGLRVLRTGVSRNLLFASAWPLFLLFPASRSKFTSKIHWLGWSAYMIAAK